MVPMQHWNEEFKRSTAGRAAVRTGGSGARQPTVDLIHGAYAAARKRAE